MKTIGRIVVLICLASSPLLFVGLVALVHSGLGAGALLLFLGIPVTLLAALSLYVSFARSIWPTTEGVVTNTEFQAGDGVFGWRDPKSDRVSLDYSYSVEGRAYSGSLKYGRRNHKLVQVIGRHPQPDATLTVYFNPRNHADSRLAVGSGSLNLTFLMLGIIAIVGGCCMLWK